MYWRFLKSLLLHKWYVILGGVKVGGISIFRLIIHDWQKFTPSEFSSYARYFQSERTDANKEAFMYAWLHHVHRGPHHWEYWLLNPGYNFSVADSGKLPMPEIYVREMVIDWLGASRAYTGSWIMVGWMNKNLMNISKNLHQVTIDRLYKILHELGYVDSGGDGWYYRP